MGEYADMAIDQMMDVDYYQLAGIWEGDDDPEWNPFTGLWSKWKRSRRITCKRCGAMNLRWGVDPDTNGWELREADWSLHRCKFKFKSRIGQVKS